MRVVGFITEYNPFHLGHKYHLDKSKEITNSTHSIAIMSGSFVQRGEPSLIDKWTKAKMAIDNGVDLVIELPFIYSVQSAELFAFGGVSILDSLKTVDYIAFGSENSDIEPLNRAAEIFNKEPMEFKVLLKKSLDRGLSYSAARSFALEKFIETTDSHNIFSYSKILKQSNNILGIEYLKALKKLNSQIEPVIIKRQGNNYNDEFITTSIASATGIRNMLFKNGLDSIKQTMPDSSFEHLKIFFDEYAMFNCLNNYDLVFQYLFRTLAPMDLIQIMDMENGLENRLLKKSIESYDINTIIDAITTKRYPVTRIKRILIHILANLNKSTITSFYDKPIEYIRILGSNKKGLELLNRIKTHSDISIITKFADYKELKNDNISSFLSFEEKATDLYFLGLSKNKPITKMDYLISPYIK